VREARNHPRAVAGKREARDEPRRSLGSITGTERARSQPSPRRAGASDTGPGRDSSEWLADFGRLVQAREPPRWNVARCRRTLRSAKAWPAGPSGRRAGTQRPHSRTGFQLEGTAPAPRKRRGARELKCPGQPGNPHGERGARDLGRRHQAHQAPPREPRDAGPGHGGTDGGDRTTRVAGHPRTPTRLVDEGQPTETAQPVSNDRTPAHRESVSRLYSGTRRNRQSTTGMVAGPSASAEGSSSRGNAAITPAPFQSIPERPGREGKAERPGSLGSCESRTMRGSGGRLSARETPGRLLRQQARDASQAPGSPESGAQSLGHALAWPAPSGAHLGGSRSEQPLSSGGARRLHLGGISKGSPCMQGTRTAASSRHRPSGRWSERPRDGVERLASSALPPAPRQSSPAALTGRERSAPE
jgi:hypothetical protein